MLYDFTKLKSVEPGVVCQCSSTTVVMLSCSIPGAIAYTNAYFGSGTGGIFMDNVGCRGTESTLLSCPYNGIGYHNCRHTDDAGVRCLGKELCSSMK